MLPAVANVILANYAAMDARIQEFVNHTSVEQQTNHSPSKPALKEGSQVDALREQVSVLEGNVSTLNTTISTNESASVKGRGGRFFLVVVVVGGGFFGMKYWVPNVCKKTKRATDLLQDAKRKRNAKPSHLHPAGS
jgi:hypothetical protein